MGQTNYSGTENQRMYRYEDIDPKAPFWELIGFDPDAGFCDIR